MEQPRDENLWRIARKRAEFRKSIFTYVVVNTFLWFIWWFTGGISRSYAWGMPWPAWVTLAWGVGLAFGYFDAYQGEGSSMTEREYERLKKKQEKL